jgi:hypothetical protein
MTKAKLRDIVIDAIQDVNNEAMTAAEEDEVADLVL